MQNLSSAAVVIGALRVSIACFDRLELIPSRSYTFVEIDHEIISTVIRLPSARRVVVSYKQKYVHKVLVNCLFKIVQEKVWLGELTVRP